MSDPRTLIAIVPKNSTDEVRVSLNRFNHHDLVDVRTFTDPRTGGSERIPTKAGVSLRIEALPALITALVRAQLAAVHAGILPAEPIDDLPSEAKTERPG
jgi:transcriptional coactivator p15 (PC4)